MILNLIVLSVGEIDSFDKRYFTFNEFFHSIFRLLFLKHFEYTKDNVFKKKGRLL